MKNIIVVTLALFLSMNVFAETWVCKQSFPDHPDAKNLLYRFDIKKGSVHWEQGFDNEFKIINNEGNYVYAVTERYFPVGSMYSLVLNKNKKLFVLNNNDATGEFITTNTKWAGPCEIVK
jgi:hypothetical protein